MAKRKKKYEDKKHLEETNAKLLNSTLNKSADMNATKENMLTSNNKGFDNYAISELDPEFNPATPHTHTKYNSKKHEGY